MNEKDPSPAAFARGQQWNDADRDIRAFLLRAGALFRDALGEVLVGVYLHGSLALGCYRRAKSDLDLLIVVRDRLDERARGDLARRICDLSDARPTLGDLELSVLQERHTHRFTHPCPFELHYGSDWKRAIRRGEVDFAADRRDADLAAHVTVTRARGARLWGEPILQVFGPVPWNDYVASVLEDFDWLARENRLFDNPVYAVLNTCRVLQLLTREPGTVASKEEGGHWGLAHLPGAHRPLIWQALDAYQSASPAGEAERPTGGLAWDTDALHRFRDFAVREAARLQDNTNRQS